MTDRSVAKRDSVQAANGRPLRAITAFAASVREIARRESPRARNVEILARTPAPAGHAQVAAGRLRLLSSVIVCGRCGKRFQGHRQVRGQTLVYYVCGGYITRRRQRM